MSTLLLKPKLDDREGTTRIISRIGLEGKAYCFAATEDLFKFTKQHLDSEILHCVLVDEGQFLTGVQVDQLGEVVDRLRIPVLVYGIRTDFQGKLFEGSHKLLALADELREIKTICHCGRKATMVVRLDADGRPMLTGTQIQVGGNDTYVSMCRRHWKAALNGTLTN